jgi:antitoxin component YwqK of YwqJK toxin-antitoxin module
MKALLLTASAVFSLGIVSWNSDHVSSNSLHSDLSSRIVTLGSGVINDPTLESILLNPAIAKKQLPGNTIQAVAHHEENKAHFIIHFRNKQLHGEWESFYNNSIPCDSGRFEKSLPDGEWKTWYADGRLKSVRHYSAEKYLFVKNDLLRNHPKVQKYAITRLAQQKKDIKGHFRPQFEHNVSDIASLPMLEKIQYNTSTQNDGYIPPFSTCLHHGPYINYHENGAVKDSGNYVNGLKQGIWKETHAHNDFTGVGFYRDGVKTGQWKYYSKDGLLKYTARYNRSGKQMSTHHFAR